MRTRKRGLREDGAGKAGSQLNSAISLKQAEIKGEKGGEYFPVLRLKVEAYPL